MNMPIITLYPPWANWVALGWKTIETRTHRRFASLVGKRIGIHVALKWDDTALTLAHDFLTLDQHIKTSRFLRVGGVIACTAFVAWHRELDPLDNKGALIDCTHIARYGLGLQDIEQIEMISCRGRQGIWYYEVPARSEEKERR